jgi:hypothetical protein
MRIVPLEGTQMPQQPSRRRRPQILDDQTGGTQRFDASEYEDTWAEDGSASDDNSVKRFMAGLTDLIRSMGGRK